jgi:hypothetical protein
VLTAGHCFHDAARHPISGTLPYATATVLVGRTTRTGPGGVVRRIVTVRQAPGGADVALAYLDRPVGGIRPVPLGTAAPRVGEVVRLAGWGATTATGAPADQLRTGLFTVSTLARTTVAVVGRSPAADTSACPYDSGAPYFRETRTGPQLVSVESTGPDCPHRGAETTYRADVLVGWVRATQRVAPSVAGRQP